MRVSDLRQRNLVSFRQEQPALDLGFQDTVLRSQIFVPHQQFLIDGAGDVGQHASPNHSRASLELIVEPGLYMLLRFQKAAGRGNYETGNQAFSKRLRFLTIRVRPLLPRGPDSSRTWEGHSRWSSCSVTAFEWPQGYLSAATGWSASPLHSRGLTISSSELNSFPVRIGDRFTPGSWQSSSPSRFRDAHSGRRPRHAKRCLPRKGPPASKTRPRLVLMNHTDTSDVARDASHGSGVDRSHVED